jgi:Na+/H+ antiporter NhaC
MGLYATFVAFIFVYIFIYMLGTSQMMLGETLRRGYLGRDYRFAENRDDECERALWLISFIVLLL